MAVVPILKVWGGMFFSKKKKKGTVKESTMKQWLASIPGLLLVIMSLTGCQTAGDKSASLSMVYGATAILSFLLLIACCRLVKKKKAWFVLLFSSVLVVNVGYTFLSLSTGLAMALWANRVAYLGSVFLPLSMLMIILNVTNTKYKKWLPKLLFALATIVFLIAASPGVMPIYYKEVSFAIVDGTSTLMKVYGPLHPIYLCYLVGYFTSMVTVIIRARLKKTIDTTIHAVILALAVFVNIGVWLVEQLTSIDFEFLSISYIISELFLLGVHLVMNEYQRMSHLVKQVETVKEYGADTAEVMLEKPMASEGITPEQMEVYMQGFKTLTPTEKTIYDAYVARVTTKEIMASMNIKESTLKYHSRNIYGKLNVSTRKELQEMHKYIKSAKAVLDRTEP